MNTHSELLDETLAKCGVIQSRLSSLQNDLYLFMSKLIDQKCKNQNLQQNMLPMDRTISLEEVDDYVYDYDYWK